MNNFNWEEEFTWTCKLDGNETVIVTANRFLRRDRTATFTGFAGHPYGEVAHFSNVVSVSLAERVQFDDGLYSLEELKCAVNQLEQPYMNYDKLLEKVVEQARKNRVFKAFKDS